MGHVARTLLATAVRRLSAVRGGRLISNSGIARTICGTGFEVATLTCGAKAVVSVGDHVGRAMYLWGRHDPRLLAVLDAVLAPGDDVIDIGANFGAVGLHAASIVRETGRVYLFEPQPMVAHCLRASVAINGYTQAEVHECALSSHDGLGVMVVAEPRNLGMTRLVADADCAGAERVTVRVENALHHIRSLPTRKAALLKIDVEGHEDVILTCLAPWMEASPPSFVLFECHIGQGGFWEEGSVKILATLGYEFLCYDIQNCWRTQLRRITLNDHAPRGYDFVAIHKGSYSTPAMVRLQQIVSQDLR